MRELHIASSVLRFPSRLKTALAVLLSARDYAKKSGTDVWDFAEELEDLRLAGATNADLRWLLMERVILHAQEIPSTKSGHRQFCPLGALAMPQRTCFVLTDFGETLARRLEEEATFPRGAVTGEDVLPRWDKELRELWCAHILVKRFRRPAANQETILEAFQEQSWRNRIDDPLPPKPDRDSKQCLHDTINHLNRNQIHSYIRFGGDGKGIGICWKYVGPTSALHAPCNGSCGSKKDG